MRFMATVTTLLIGSTCGTVHGADEGRPRYSLKQDEPELGTHLKKNVATGNLPIDKAYAELSDADKAYVKSQYEQMRPDDEPPFPANGLRPIYKAIAAGQQKLLVTGLLNLAVNVNDRGEATSVSVFQSPDPEMTRYTASVLMLQKYKPALCEGRPCAMQFPFSVVFSRGL